MLDIGYTAGPLERNTVDTLRKASWEKQLWFARESRILTGLLTSVCLDSVLAEQDKHHSRCFPSKEYLKVAPFAKLCLKEQ